MTDADCTPGREPRSISASSAYYSVKFWSFCHFRYTDITDTFFITCNVWHYCTCINSMCLIHNWLLVIMWVTYCLKSLWLSGILYAPFLMREPLLCSLVGGSLVGGRQRPRVVHCLTSAVFFKYFAKLCQRVYGHNISVISNSHPDLTPIYSHTSNVAPKMDFAYGIPLYLWHFIFGTLIEHSKYQSP